MSMRRKAVELVRSGARSLGLERNYPKSLAVAAANAVTVEFVRQSGCSRIAEIGAYHGDTSVEFAKYLNGNGELHIFDRAEYVEHTLRRLREAGHTNVRGFSSSGRLLDSYNWTLGRLLAEHRGPIYDYVFLDGAHTWAIDGFAALLADRLLKVGGHLDFDDYHWNLVGSPCLNPRVFPLTARLYTDEQMEAFQVQMIVDVLIRPDPRYKEVVANKIFQKIAG
jgi:predicted O-methyltransferase YrrM